MSNELPLIQIDDIIRPMTGDEYDEYLERVATEPPTP